MGLGPCRFTGYEKKERQTRGNKNVEALGVQAKGECGGQKKIIQSQPTSQTGVDIQFSTKVTYFEG